MKTRQKVYCDFQFIKIFFIDGPYEKGFLSMDERDCWLNVYHFIQNSTMEFYNSDESDLLDLKNKMEGRSDVFEPVYSSFVNFEFIKKDILSEIDNDNEKMNSIYLTNLPEDECKEISQKYGVIVLNNKTIIDSNYLFEHNDRAIPKNNLKKDSHVSWKTYMNKNISYACNSLIIEDSFLFQDTKKMKENLEPILDVFLPQTLEVPFYITLLGEIRGSGQDVFNIVCDMLKVLRPKLEVKISICKTYKDFHDRVIISNNIWFSCVAGFDLFKNKKAEKSTQSDVVYPFFIQHSNAYPQSYLNQIYEIIKVSKRDHRNGFDLWSTDNSDTIENRLIAYYKD